MWYRRISNEITKNSGRVDTPLVVIGYAWWSFILFSSFVTFAIVATLVFGAFICEKLSTNIVRDAFCFVICFFLLVFSLRIFLTEKIELYNDKVIQSFIFFRPRMVLLSKACYYTFFYFKYIFEFSYIYIYDQQYSRSSSLFRSVFFYYLFCKKSDVKGFFETLANLTGRNTKELKFTRKRQKLMRDNSGPMIPIG
jgi:hypothetical protein